MAYHSGTRQTGCGTVALRLELFCASCKGQNGVGLGSRKEIGQVTSHIWGQITTAFGYLLHTSLHTKCEGPGDREGIQNPGDAGREGLDLVPAPLIQATALFTVTLVD